MGVGTKENIYICASLRLHTFRPVDKGWVKEVSLLFDPYLPIYALTSVLSYDFRFEWCVMERSGEF